MIDVLIFQLHQYYLQVMTWYAGVGTLAQYGVIFVSGTAVFLVGVMMILSKMLK